MREQYICKGFIHKSLDELKNHCEDDIEKQYIDSREKLICSMRTREARRYLYFETVNTINNW
jgi:hypothetical protein